MVYRYCIGHTPSNTINFKERLKRLTLNVTRTKDSVMSGIFADTESLSIHGKSFGGKQYHVNFYQNEPKILSAIARLCSLDDENVAQIKGVFFYDDNKYPVLIIEVLESSLAQMNLQHVSFNTRLEILHKVANGLSYLHGQNPSIIHFSLTAENVLVNSSLSRVKLGGIEDGQVVDHKSLFAHYQSIPSIAMYMPPEILSPESILNTKFDIFSFGHLALCVLASDLSCKNLLPFKGTIGDSSKHNSNTELLRRQHCINDLAEILKDHGDMDDTIQHCLCNNPQNR